MTNAKKFFQMRESGVPLEVRRKFRMDFLEILWSISFPTDGANGKHGNYLVNYSSATLTVWVKLFLDRFPFNISKHFHCCKNNFRLQSKTRVFPWWSKLLSFRCIQKRAHRARRHFITAKLMWLFPLKETKTAYCLPLIYPGVYGLFTFWRALRKSQNPKQRVINIQGY